MYKYLFGPVPSRRLGMSLGVDLVPHKTCSFNCIYCECGKTTLHTTERKEYVPCSGVINELSHYFMSHPAPDYVTLSGAGEPTLNSRFGEILGFIKGYRRKIPVAVLTNGSLLSDRNVRKELMLADVVLPSLDAAEESAFHKINRPFRGILLDEYIRGLADFRKEFSGRIWLEVLILPGYNDTAENILALKKSITEIKPDKIQLNTLDRPGLQKDLRPATLPELEKIVELWKPLKTEIIASVANRKEIKSYRDDYEEAILETIARRPCTVDDLSGILGLHTNEVNKYLGALEARNRIRTVPGERGVFYEIRKNG